MFPIKAVDLSDVFVLSHSNKPLLDKVSDEIQRLTLMFCWNYTNQIKMNLISSNVDQQEI